MFVSKPSWSVTTPPTSTASSLNFCRIKKRQIEESGLTFVETNFLRPDVSYTINGMLQCDTASGITYNVILENNLAIRLPNFWVDQNPDFDTFKQDKSFLCYAGEHKSSTGFTYGRLRFINFTEWNSLCFCCKTCMDCQCNQEPIHENRLYNRKSNSIDMYGERLAVQAVGCSSRGR